MIILVVRDAVVRLSSKNVTTLQRIDSNIDKAVSILLARDNVNVINNIVIKEDTLREMFAKANMEIIDRIDLLRKQT